MQNDAQLLELERNMLHPAGVSTLEIFDYIFKISMKKIYFVKINIFIYNMETVEGCNIFVCSAVSFTSFCMKISG